MSVILIFWALIQQNSILKQIILYIHNYYMDLNYLPNIFVISVVYNIRKTL